MNDTTQSAGPDLSRTRDLLSGIRSDIQAVQDAKTGLDRALNCLRAGLDDRFLDELEQVAKAYLDSERGRLFAMRNSKAGSSTSGGLGA